MKIHTDPVFISSDNQIFLNQRQCEEHELECRLFSQKYAYFYTISTRKNKDDPFSEIHIACTANIAINSISVYHFAMLRYQYPFQDGGESQYLKWFINVSTKVSFSEALKEKKNCSVLSWEHGELKCVSVEEFLNEQK